MHLPALLAALLVSVLLVVGCFGRSPIAAIVTEPPTAPAAPTSTPTNSKETERLRQERDDLQAKLDAVDSRLKSAEARDRQHQLDIIAAWLLWISILAILAGIVLAVFGLRGVGSIVGSCGLGALAFSRALAEYGWALKYVGALGAIGLVAWVAWSHRKRAVAADASITAIEQLKEHVDEVIGPDNRKALLSEIIGGASAFIESRRVALGLKQKDAA